MSTGKIGYEVTLRPVAMHSVPGVQLVSQGIMRGYVATEERAKEIVAEVPTHRSYRALPYSEMPEGARLELERAGRERA